MLEIIVHNCDQAAPGESKPRHDRVVLTKVSAEVDSDDAAVSRAEVRDDRPRAIGRAVIDQNQLVAVLGGLERLADRGGECFKALFAAKDGNDYRNIWLARRIG